MSYLSFDELEISEFSMNSIKNTYNPISEQVIIPSRTVRFRERIEDSIQFEKDSPPIACSSLDVKFQVPCDTITTSSNCYQTSRVFTLMR